MADGSKEQNSTSEWSLMPDLRGQVAIVTGGGRGIGRATGRALGAAGATVVLVARSETEISEVATEILDAGGTAVTVAVDLSDLDQVRSLFSQVYDQFGKLDILINNAAITVNGAIADYSVDDYDALMAVNLRAVFFCCQEAMKIMIPRKSGYIINVSSASGIKGYPDQAAYCATKHGVMGLTKVLALEAQHHQIRVSAVLPGGVDTTMLNTGRPDLTDRSVLLQPVDLANSILFLLALPARAAIDQIYLRRYASTPFSL